MNNPLFLQIIPTALTAFAASVALSPLVLTLAKKLKAQQTVLHYVEQHSGKSGTPTTGGWIFLLAATFAVLIFCRERLAVMTLAISLAYGTVGFLDDYIKIRFHRNEGLKAYQKIIAQFGIAVIVSVFVAENEFLGGAILLPFADGVFDVSWGIIPLVLFIYLATTNAVNLTDGLDGLAGWTSFVYLCGFCAICYLLAGSAVDSGESVRATELFALSGTSLSFAFAVLGFLCLNSYPAKIMMGDTGSLALGGCLASVAVFSREPLLILFSGIMYVVSCISVIVQVAVFKLKGKRVFLMAPFHHHLEKKGWHEAKITAVYVVITLVGTLIAILATGRAL